MLASILRKIIIIIETSYAFSSSTKKFSTKNFLRRGDKYNLFLMGENNYYRLFEKLKNKILLKPIKFFTLSFSFSKNS